MLETAHILHNRVLPEPLHKCVVLPFARIVRNKMKTIEVDDELYSYIASHTKHIGESASDILRRMLKFSAASQPAAPVTKEVRVA